MADNGLLTRLTKWVVQRSGVMDPWMWSDWMGTSSESSAGIPISQWSAMQEVTCLSCVLIRAGDLAKCPVHIYRVAEDGEQLVQTNHAAERLLREPNGQQTPLEFFETLQASLLLTQNAYAPIRRNGRGEPVELIPINPDRVTLYEAVDGDIYYQVSCAGNFERAQLRGFPDKIPAADMLHLRGLSLNGLVGLSRIWMARDAIGLSMAMEKTASKLFGKGAHPSIILSTDKNITDDVYERTKARFEERSGGLDNAGKMMLLGAGIKPIPIQMTMVDAEFAANEKNQIEKIARLFQVPPHRLGLNDGGGEGILKAHQMYLNNTIALDAKRIEAKLNLLFGLDGVNEFIEFDLDSFNLADPATRTETARVAVVGGLSTPNEFRRAEGKGPKPGGDTLFRPMNVVPMDTPVVQPGTGPGSDTTGKPAPGGDGDPSGLPGKSLSNGHDVTVN